MSGRKAVKCKCVATEQRFVQISSWTSILHSLVVTVLEYKPPNPPLNPRNTWKASWFYILRSLENEKDSRLKAPLCYGDSQQLFLE